MNLLLMASLAVAAVASAAFAGHNLSIMQNKNSMIAGFFGVFSLVVAMICFIGLLATVNGWDVCR